MSLPEGIRSIDGVCELQSHASPGAEDRRPDPFIELPHGATRRSDYDRLRARLSPELPPDLIDYFFVNTDVGSWEYATQVARQLTKSAAAGAPLKVLVARCLVPRAFIDTNRVIQAGRSEAKEAGLSTATAEYIREEADARLLHTLHAQYHAVVEAAYDWICGAGGQAMAAHTYAPRSIEIDSYDEGIGRALRRAYEPEQYGTWKKRPAIDIISEDPEGKDLAPRELVQALRKEFDAQGIEAVENGVYCLHPVSMAYHYAARYPGQVLCLEVSRDLLAEPFSPFEEMAISEHKAARIAAPIAAAYRDILSARV